MTGPDEDIPVPPGCVDLDFELEVAAIIGRAGTRPARRTRRARTSRGYTIFNDWSARDLQLAEMRLGLGPCKGKDFANTLGPWIVTPTSSSPIARATASISSCAPRSTVRRSAPTRSPTWPGASRSSSPTPRAARGCVRETCSARGPAAAAACSSSGGGAAATACRRSRRATSVSLHVEGIGTLAQPDRRRRRADTAAAARPRRAGGPMS